MRLVRLLLVLSSRGTKAQLLLLRVMLLIWCGSRKVLLCLVLKLQWLLLVLKLLLLLLGQPSWELMLILLIT
jgi:hypothetical protein